jgi:hypothetical protein
MPSFLCPFKLKADGDVIVRRRRGNVTMEAGIGVVQSTPRYDSYPQMLEEPRNEISPRASRWSAGIVSTMILIVISDFWPTELN